MLIPRVLTRFLILIALASTPAVAQNPFAPIVQVNEDVITAYELQQRVLFLRIVSPADSGQAVARRELINERLRAQAVRSAGIELSEQDILDGMSEFSGRVNLTSEEFITALAQRGVSEETFRDFVANGLGWRDLIRARFGNRVQISPAEVDRAMTASGSGSGVRVLLSEIIIPAPPPQLESVMARAEQISQSKSEGEFSGYARRFSATATRARGGRLPWTPLTQLPPALRPIVLALGPGEVTAPIPIPNAVALFQLRGIEETSVVTPEYSAIEYAQYFIPGGRTEATLATAAKIANQVDVCDDLYGIANGQPEEILDRKSQKPEEIPQDIALELAKLDTDEVSTALTTSDGQNLILLMMCGRTAAANEDVGRDVVVTQLRQQRLSGLAESYLEELRADARIREK